MDLSSLSKIYTLKECEDFGYDYGLNGATEINCDFRIFSSHARMKAWEKGKKKATPGAE